MKLTVLLFLTCLSLTGCLDRSGDYAGYISKLDGLQNTQHPVQIHVGHVTGGGTIDCVVDEAGSPHILSSEFSIRLKGKSAYVDDLRPNGGTIELLKDKNSQCWRSEDPKAFACLDSTGFQFQLDLDAHTQIHFFTNKGAAVPRVPVTRSAGTFTIDQLRSLSVRGSFDNRMEYETLIQAKKQAQIASLSLAPRLTVNGIGNEITGGPLGLLTSVSELAPFLFPSNWFAAKSQERTAKATAVAAHLLKVDIAMQVETLAAQISRDESILRSYVDLESETAPIREQISVREQLGQYPQGSLNNIDSILNEIRQDQIALKETLSEERRGLAQMVGLGDLNSIHAIDWSDDSNPIGQPLKVSSTTALERAVSRSLEIAQVQLLIEAAQMKVKQAFWSWLDPNGGPTTGIGLANGAGVSLQKSQLQSLQIQSEQIYSLIQQKTQNALQQLSTAEQSYALAQTTLDINNARKNQIFDRIRLGVTVDFFGLVQILQDNLKTQVDVQNSEAAYRTSKAAVNRYLMQGAYGHIGQGNEH